MNLYDLFNEEKVRLDPKCWKGKKIGNPKTKMKGGVRVNNCVPAESIAENTGQPLTVQQLAAISDEALDQAYGYGRSTPSNTFGWQANLKSAAYAKQMIDQGVTDIEAISDAIHKGWNTTAQAFVQDPDQFDDTAKLAAAGKLEAKLQQRAQLMKQNYAQLPEEEKEKDRVVARALLQAIRGNQGVAEGVMYGAENLHVGDDVVITGDVEFNGATGVIDSFGQGNRFVVVNLYNHGRHSFHSSDVSANDYDSDEHDDDMAEGMWDQHQSIPELEKAIENLIMGYKGGINLTDKGRAQLLLSINKGKRILAKKKQQQDMAEGEQQKGADYRDPKEVDYDDEYDAMVARVKKLAGLGPMKTVYDPAKRQYRNMPTAVQPKK
jgi:hypothetical protein